MEDSSQAIWVLLLEWSMPDEAGWAGAYGPYATESEAIAARDAAWEYYENDDYGAPRGHVFQLKPWEPD